MISRVANRMGLFGGKKTPKILIAIGVIVVLAVAFIARRRSYERGYIV